MLCFYFAFFILSRHSFCGDHTLQQIKNDVVNFLDGFEIYPPPGDQINLMLKDVKEIEINRTFIEKTKRFFHKMLFFIKKQVNIQEDEDCENCLIFNKPAATFSFIPQMTSKTYYILLLPQKQFKCSPKILKFNFFFQKELVYQTDFTNVTFLEQRISFGDQKIKFDAVDVEAYNSESMNLCLSTFKIVS